MQEYLSAADFKSQLFGLQSGVGEKLGAHFYRTPCTRPKTNSENKTGEKDESNLVNVRTIA